MKATETRFGLSSTLGLSHSSGHVVIGVDASIASWTSSRGRIAVGGAAVANHGSWHAWRRCFRVDPQFPGRASTIAELFGACRAARAVGVARRAVLVTDNTTVARDLPEILAGGLLPSWIPPWIELPTPHPDTDIEVVWSNRTHVLVAGADEIARLMRYGLRSKKDLLVEQFEEIAANAVAGLYGNVSLGGAA